MLRLDEFESAFRAAERCPYGWHPFALERVMGVSDLQGDAFFAFRRTVESTGGAGWKATNWSWLQERGEEPQFAALIEGWKPDLLVGYRNLFSDSWKWPRSLGSVLNMLIHQVETPLLVLPNPKERPAFYEQPWTASRVVVLTDHLTGDHALVNWAVTMAPEGATLCLVHVEDDVVFGRYVAALSKVPGVDTDTATQQLMRQLLKEPLDYIQSVKHELGRRRPDLTVESLVTAGHQTGEVVDLVSAKGADLLVLRGRDEGTVGMHRNAHGLLVTFRAVPVLAL